MPMASKGLVKVIEECGELQQVAAKQLAFPSRDDHPDGQGSLRERLEDEMADVRAACLFVEKKLRLNRERMAVRTLEKLRRFREWDQGED